MILSKIHRGYLINIDLRNNICKVWFLTEQVSVMRRVDTRWRVSMLSPLTGTPLYGSGVNGNEFNSLQMAIDAVINVRNGHGRSQEFGVTDYINHNSSWGTREEIIEMMESHNDAV